MVPDWGERCVTDGGVLSTPIAACGFALRLFFRRTLGGERGGGGTLS